MNATRAERISSSNQLVAPPRAEQVRILLVEDERFVREVATEILVSAGHRVLKARTGSEAMKIFLENQEPVDLLVTDVVLPGKDGYFLSDELTIICPKMKTIFMSGYPEKALPNGGKGKNRFYLPKPFSVGLLIRKVEEALRRETPEFENPSN
jgi:two-component system cell cycle sensor histidine kinase/response regulator CckA